MDLQLNSTIGEYQVVDVLARVAGKAYKVRNVSTGQVATMRVLMADVAQAPGVSQQWAAAVRPLAALRHPNIASVEGVLEADNRLLLLTEFVEGVSLDEKAGAGPLPVEQAVDTIRQALAALACAHGSGIIHGGVKPSEIIVTPAGIAKLTGFGATAPNAAGAASPYQAPEVIAGGAPDARSDIYAAAACLYRAVTGKQPEAAIAADRQLPPLLNQLISMAAAQDPAARFKSAAALGNALRSLAPTPPAEPAAATPPAPVASAAPVAPPAPDPPAAPVAVAAATEPVATPANAPRIAQLAPAPPVRGHRGLWMALGALAAIALIVAAIEFVPWKGTKAAPPQTPPAQSAPVIATPEPQPPPPAAETPASPAPPVQSKSQPAMGQAPARAPGSSTVRQATPPAAAAPAPQAEPSYPAGAAQQPPEPAAPSAAQLAEAREHYALLGARASGIRASLQTMRNSMAAHGMNLRGDIQTADTMMTTYLRSANDALSAGELAQAESQMEKAEHQIAILEKFLNR